MENICFNEFCRNQKCPEYIKWDCGMGFLESCKLIGQSYNIYEYPQDCLFINEIKEYEKFQDNALDELCKTHINKMVENQNFGQAIEALKQGKRVARQGWNGKGMFLFLLPAGTVPTKAIHDPALREVIEQEIGGETFEALGSIRMFTADKKILTGWLASQTDILSEDWVIL